MTIAQDFIKKLQDATGKESLPKFGDLSRPTFQDVLSKYAEYYKDLSSPEKVEMSEIFWEQVTALGGTPIVEDSLDSELECEVYFLLPKNNLAQSTEIPSTKKDLYLQGDFHGYDSTDEDKQRLLELSDSGVMWRKDRMPKNAIVVYQYIQVEPSYRGKNPEPELPPFFEDGDKFAPHTSNTAKFPEIESIACIDKYSTHTSQYFFDSPAKILRIHSDPQLAHIQGKPIDWPSLLNTETPSNTKHFSCHATLYSDTTGALHPSDAPITDQYHDDLYYSDQADSPYANFTRAIQVFKPASGKKIDDIIVVNDGMLSLITGSMDQFEKMVAEKKLSPNTAFVFINTLPGLKNALSPKAAKNLEEDPSKDLDGMGVRLIDYKHGIDQYIDFIDKLFLQLKKEIGIPDNPSHRVMIGSSLSGTASIYIGAKRPDLFGAVIAQSPSSANRVILSEIPREMLTGKNIHLSCGMFEHPNYAAANAFLEYAVELSRKLGIPLHTGAHGHQCVAWNEELEESLPATLRDLSTIKATQKYKIALEDVIASEDASTTVIERDVAEEEHRVPSPFQMTPKPSDEG